MASPSSVTVTLGQIVDAVETALSTATGLLVHESYDELTEGVHDKKLLQVYPESCSPVDVSTDNDRTTSQRGVAATELVIHADLYAQQRAHIGEDMAALVPLIDAITARLEAQKRSPLFGLTVTSGAVTVTPIKSFKWEWRRVTFRYADADHVGARFIITLRVF